ncbi:vgr related protein [uncultured Sphingomonas sp.]|uniref:vgr related protein n=1 Tax=uncultured Sphingomonas sp. TaxID=158754 RepID=UPI0035CBAA2F
MTPPGGARPLTDGERALARSIYRDAIGLDRVEVRRRCWWPFQPRNIVMAPTGHIHLHPESASWSEDFSREGHGLQGLFVHELCHVWQHQRGLFLPLRRHPLCRYDYSFRPGVPLTGYGIEQQAEIVRHAFLLREGVVIAGAPALNRYEGLLTVFG